MRELTIEEIRKIQLDMLEFIDNTCRQHNIRYCVSGGTLIGAVRHNGFIPWDDDIDMDMPRPDYERFKEIMKGSDRYRLLSDEDETYFSYGKFVDKTTLVIDSACTPQIKDMGVFIDIFPVDGLPEKKYFSVFKSQHSLSRRISAFSNNGPRHRRNYILRAVDEMFWLYDRKKGLKSLKRNFLNNALKYDFDKSEMVCVPGGGYGKREIYPRRYFDSFKRCRFESIEVNIPGGYDEFLRQMYGDYMQLPPPEKRVANHTLKIYWRE